MSRPSAAPSNRLRPDYHCGDRALKILGEHLKSSDMFDAVRDAYKAAPAQFVRLPGFDLFTVGARSPYEWCVPKPRDAEQVINIYEEYVDRELGRVPAPERVAKRLYSAFKVSKAYFGPSPRPSNRWYVPAAKIIAAAQHFDAVVTKRGHRLSTSLLGYTLMVSPMACHSNLHRASVATPVAALDFGPTELVVPSLHTKHPLAVVLTALGADESCLWAANTAIRAESQKLVNIEQDLFPVERKKILSAAEKRVRAETVRIAAMEATEVALGHPTPIPALYEAMVPSLCTAQRFKLVIGDPWKHPGRSPRPETRNAWVTQIEHLSTEALHELA